jgi:hypothetical protein
MKLKPCPACGNPLAPSAASCPKCGHTRQTGRGILAAVLVGVLLFLVFVFLTRH